jgi:protease secretion system outer membrane protein
VAIIERKRLPLIKTLAAGSVAAALLMHTGGAAAIGLLQAYRDALQSDPTFQSAVHEYTGGQENRILGRAGLLPNVQASYSASKNRTDLTQFGEVSHPVYISRSSTIQVQQALINFDAWARYKLGLAQADYSSAQFAGRQQELIVRVVSAYMDTLLNETQLRLVEVQRDTFQEQMKVNDQLFAKGEGTKTDMLETQAKLDLAEAQVLEARDNLASSRTTLAGIVGHEVVGLDDLAPDFRIGQLPDGSYDKWKEISLQSNAEITAQRFAIEAAHQDVNKTKAGHTPRLDLVGSYGKNTSQTIDELGQDSTVRSIGIQLTVPLYSGGSVSAGTRQAVASEEKAKSDLQVTIDKVTVELRKQYSTVVSSVARIRALEKAVSSSSLLIQATEKSILGGVRINLDLLNAKQQLYTSQRDLAQARYNYLLAIVKLRAAAGTLSDQDLLEVAAYFH